jgi:hypothetical protein
MSLLLYFPFQLLRVSFCCIVLLYIIIMNLGFLYLLHTAIIILVSKAVEI